MLVSTNIDERTLGLFSGVWFDTDRVSGIYRIFVHPDSYNTTKWNLNKVRKNLYAIKCRNNDFGTQNWILSYEDANGKIICSLTNKRETLFKLKRCEDNHFIIVTEDGKKYVYANKKEVRPGDGYFVSVTDSEKEATKFKFL